MKLFAFAAAAVTMAAASCYMDDLEEGFPVQPAGTTPPGINGTGAVVIVGRVCMRDDLLRIDRCVAVGVGGLTVALGGATTVTAVDGTFSLPVPTTTPLAFTVSGPGAVTTTTPYSPSPFVPVVNADVWATTLASNSITLPEGAGSIMGTVTSAGQPATGVTVVSTPTSSFGPFYDTSTPGGFGTTGTGARGVFFVPGVTAGSASLAFSPGETTVAGISVVNGGVTILDSMILP